MEDAYLGAHFRLPDEESTLDLSYGRQPYRIGSGRLISVGAMNGFERGATTTFARRAWEEAGIVKWTRGPLSLDGFYLNPNELRSGDTDTRLAGTRFEWNPDPSRSLGIAYFHVFESIFPYVAAPVRLIPDGREGLNTLHAYGRWNPRKDDHPGWHVAGDYAHQRNDRIPMTTDYWHVRADEVNSPVQFGQAGRISSSGGEPQLVAGVPDPHLSDDFYVEYTRVISPQIFLTAGFAVSVPGQGLRELVENPGTWTGGLVNLTVKY